MISGFLNRFEQPEVCNPAVGGGADHVGRRRWALEAMDDAVGEVAGKAQSRLA